MAQNNLINKEPDMAKIPTSEVLKNATEAAKPYTVMDVELQDTYFENAVAAGAVMTGEEMTPYHDFASTWHWPPFEDKQEAFDETIYTTKPFPEIAPPRPTSQPVLDAVHDAVRDAIAPGAKDNWPRATETDYTQSLRSGLLEQHRYLTDEIARLNRLTEDAMKAESAIKNALSSLDHDGV